MANQSTKASSDVALSQFAGKGTSRPPLHPTSSSEQNNGNSHDQHGLSTPIAPITINGSFTGASSSMTSVTMTPALLSKHPSYADEWTGGHDDNQSVHRYICNNLCLWLP